VKRSAERIASTPVGSVPGMRMAAFCLALLLAAAAVPALAQGVLAREFSAGQVWAYKSRPGEEESRLLINKVDVSPVLGPIFHISITGLRVKHRDPAQITTDLPHLAVSIRTLQASCTKLVGESAPDARFLEGYAQWKQVFEQGKAGVWTAPLAAIVQAVEDAMMKN
jgi:hypothetical protein